MAASIGTYGKLAIGDTSTVDTRLQYGPESVLLDQAVMDGNLLRGTRAHDSTVMRDGLIRVGGPISLQPTAAEWVDLLPWIMGGTPTGTTTKTFPFAELLPAKYLSIDRVIKVFQYDGCKVDTATFRAVKGGFLDLTLDVVGIGETVNNAGTFPAISLRTDAPFIFHDLTITVGGTPVKCDEYTLTIRHMIDRERFLSGALTLSEVNALDREVTLTTRLPYGDYSAQYAAGLAAGVAVVATFTNGAKTMVHTFAKVHFNKQSPTTPGRQEIMFPLSGRAGKSGADEVVITVTP